jgi:hypothetical protein
MEILKHASTNNSTQAVISMFRIYGVKFSVPISEQFNHALVDDLLSKNPKDLSLFLCKNILLFFPNADLQGHTLQELELIFQEEIFLIMENKENLRNLLKGIFILAHSEKHPLLIPQGLELLRKGVRPLMQKTPQSQLLKYLASSPETQRLLSASLSQIHMPIWLASKGKIKFFATFVEQRFKPYTKRSSSSPELEAAEGIRTELAEIPLSCPPSTISPLNPNEICEEESPKKSSWKELFNKSNPFKSFGSMKKDNPIIFTSKTDASSQTSSLPSVKK